MQWLEGLDAPRQAVVQAHASPPMLTIPGRCRPASSQGIPTT
jgi:hypothetical protein